MCILHFFINFRSKSSFAASLLIIWPYNARFRPYFRFYIYFWRCMRKWYKIPYAPKYSVLGYMV